MRATLLLGLILFVSTPVLARAQQFNVPVSASGLVCATVTSAACPNGDTFDISGSIDVSAHVNTGSGLNGDRVTLFGNFRETATDTCTGVVYAEQFANKKVSGSFSFTPGVAMTESFAFDTTNLGLNDMVDAVLFLTIDADEHLSATAGDVSMFCF